MGHKALTKVGRISWNADKNEKLRRERNVSFQDVVYPIANPTSSSGAILDTFDHPNQDRYPDQKIHVVDIDGYAYLVPFVESEDEIFLKTIIPSRKATKTYLERKA